MTDGYKVDLDALHEACVGIRRLLDEIEDKPVRDLSRQVQNFGDADLAGAVDDFSRRWQRGVAHLVTDVKEIDDRLQRAIRSYAEREKDAVDQLKKVISEDHDG